MSETNQSAKLDIIDAQTAPVVASLDVQTAANLRQSYSPHFVALKPWLEKAAALAPITDASQVREMKLAREVRLALKEIRIDADKTRKKLKADALIYGKAVDGLFNVLVLASSPVEEKLEEQEKFVVLQEQKRVEALVKDRSEKLLAIKVDPKFYNLAEMPADVFESLLATQKAAYDAAIAAAEKAAADAKAAKDAEDARIEAQRVENERLKAEAAEREKQHAADLKAAEDEKQRVANEAKAKSDQQQRELEEADRKARAAEIEANNLRADIEAAEDKRKKDLADFQEQERLNREKLAAETRALQITQDKLRLAQEAAAKDRPAQSTFTEEQRPRKIDQRSFAGLSDNKLLTGIVTDLREIRTPSMSTVAGSQLALNLKGALAQVADWLDEEIKKLPVT